MKRALTIAGITAALALPALAWGSVDRYKASGLGGSLSAGLEFNAHFKGKHPKSITDLQWFNVPCISGGAANSDKQSWSIKVHDDRTFSKSHQVDDYPNQTVEISGKFTHHNHKVPGRFKLTGPSSGCSSGTLTLDY